MLVKMKYCGGMCIQDVGQSLVDIKRRYCLFVARKHERTAQVPSYHAVSGPDESVWCGLDLGQGYIFYLGMLFLTLEYVESGNAVTKIEQSKQKQIRYQEGFVLKYEQI